MRMIAIAVLGILLPLGGANAADLLGTWTGTSRAVVVGSGGHYGKGGEAAFRQASLTIEWTSQDDNRLIGTITSAGQSEPKIGVISSDGTTLVTADTDGSSVGRLIDDNHFELCYTQTSAGDDQMVASCVLFERTAQH